MEPLDIASKVMVTVSPSITSIDTVVQPMGLFEEREESCTVKQLDQVAGSNSYGAYLDVCKHCKHILVYNNLDCDCHHLQDSMAPLNMSSRIADEVKSLSGVEVCRTHHDLCSTINKMECSLNNKEVTAQDMDMDSCINQIDTSKDSGHNWHNNNYNACKIELLTLYFVCSFS